MDDHKAMQNESEELAAFLGFDIDFNFDFESLFRELPPDAEVSRTNDTSSIPLGPSQATEDGSSNLGLLYEIVKILQCHLAPTEPRPMSELNNENVPSRLRHLLDVTRRHFEASEKTPTVHAPDAKTASGNKIVSKTPLPDVDASGNTEEGA
ncbi:hypothetical protein PIB30_100285 [Stylosanthes scabra]|uniref:Uncharacterized protein n=1 Tax=Stylosanthes scabra TaxID=79078 RepID=A0ABU6UWP7_9FABA|nr:hypothetical protein [Stylosanthes scabra]